MKLVVLVVQLEENLMGRDHLGEHDTKLGFCQHCDIHRVGIYYGQVMNKGAYRLWAHVNANSLCALEKSCHG